uniref:Uncharacterized protein n=1 Tax=Anopheles merus TaxID=30066 RepID=A0A182UYM6_ANOME
MLHGELKSCFGYLLCFLQMGLQLGLILGEELRWVQVGMGLLVVVVVLLLLLLLLLLQLLLLMMTVKLQQLGLVTPVQMRTATVERMRRSRRSVVYGQLVQLYRLITPVGEVAAAAAA